MFEAAQMAAFAACSACSATSRPHRAAHLHNNSKTSHTGNNRKKANKYTKGRRKAVKWLILPPYGPMEEQPHGYSTHNNYINVAKANFKPPQTLSHRYPYCG